MCSSESRWLHGQAPGSPLLYPPMREVHFKGCQGAWAYLIPFCHYGWVGGGAGGNGRRWNPRD